MKDGGSAFPKTNTYVPGEGMDQNSDGMTLRDYLAAKAMVALKSNPAWDGSELFSSDYSKLATASYKIADAMIKEKMKGGD